MSKKEFYFYPNQEEIFKKRAKNNFVFTLVYDKDKLEIVLFFKREVRSKWKQSCKNNIETDHRIKELQDSNYQIYSWIFPRSQTPVW